MKQEVEKCRICGCSDNNPCKGGCYWQEPSLCSRCVSKDKKAEKLVGLRKEYYPLNAIPFDQPCELGYHCPVCKYKLSYKGNYDERLNWSEYQGFLWCEICNKDYPSALCMPNIDRAIDIYLDCVEQAILRAKKKMKNRPEKLKAEVK